MRAIYDFEELDEDDLHRPPLAALPALRCTGVLLSGAGWLAAPPDVRQALMVPGAREIVDSAAVRGLYPRWDDPSPCDVPAQLLDAIAHARAVPLELWQSLRALDRHVLLMLSKNTRLLWRALDELARVSIHGTSVVASRAWHGLLGRCELPVPLPVVARVTSPDIMDGRALVLARVAGVRAARRTGALLDLRAHVGTGPIELGCHTRWGQATLIWQAHVSTAQGGFFLAASLLAATTAGTALLDMLDRGRDRARRAPADRGRGRSHDRALMA